MIKKSLMIFLVLLSIILTGSIQAGTLYFEPGSGISNLFGQWQVIPGSTVTINIKADVPVDNFQLNNIVITGAFSDVKLGTVNSGFDFAPNPGTLRPPGITGVAGGTLAYPPVAVGQILYWFSLKAGQSGTITIDDLIGNPYGGPVKGTRLNSISNNVDMAPLTITIPEPMTITLLGLGGLLLRRRIKKS